MSSTFHVGRRGKCHEISSLWVYDSMTLWLYQKHEINKDQLRKMAWSWFIFWLFSGLHGFKPFSWAVATSPSELLRHLFVQSERDDDHVEVRPWQVICDTLWCHQTWLAGQFPNWMEVLIGKSLIHGPFSNISDPIPGVGKCPNFSHHPNIGKKWYNWSLINLQQIRLKVMWHKYQKLDIYQPLKIVLRVSQSLLADEHLANTVDGPANSYITYLDGWNMSWNMLETLESYEITCWNPRNI